MANLLFTVLFDLFLIGSTAAIVTALVAEARLTREPHVGLEKRRARRASPSRARQTASVGGRRPVKGRLAA
jgi:hypothetical protein